MEKVRKTRCLRLIFGALTLLFAGLIYAWSILKAPLASEFGWSASALAFNYTLTICFFCLSGLVSGLLAKKLSCALRLIIAALLLFSGFFITSRLSGGSVIPLYLGYGVLAGSGIGFVYNVVIASTTAWFPDKKGLCSGVLLMAFGASSLIVGSIANSLMESPAVGWRASFVILGGVTAAVLIVAAFIVKLPPEGVILPSAAKKAASRRDTDVEPVECTGSALFRRPTFWKMFVFFSLNAMIGSIAISSAKDISVGVGASASLAVTLAGVLSVFNGLGRIVSGLIYDSRGARFTQYITSVVNIVAPAVTLAALLLDSLALGVVGLCLCGLTYGFCPTVSAAMMAAFYGTKHYAANLGLINLVLIPAAFSATLGGAVFGATGSFTAVFIMLICFSVVGLAINLSIRRP